MTSKCRRGILNVQAKHVLSSVIESACAQVCSTCSHGQHRTAEQSLNVSCTLVTYIKPIWLSQISCIYQCQGDDNSGKKLFVVIQTILEFVILWSMYMSRATHTHLQMYIPASVSGIQWCHLLFPSAAGWLLYWGWQLPPLSSHTPPTHSEHYGWRCTEAEVKQGP